MAFKSKILITILIVIGFDAVASALSRSFHYDYTRLVWVSFLIYLVVGYWGARNLGITYGVLLGAVAGLADSTIGWFISRMIGPFTKIPIPTLSPAVVAVVILTTTSIGFMFGLIGAGLWRAIGQSKAVST
jgi:hypothetical protein